METVAYKQVGLHEIHVDVYHPDSYATSGLPVVLWLHGGGLIFGSRADLGTLWREQLERYLALGVVVVAPDYRLAPETTLDAIVEDVHDAYDWLRDRGPHAFGIDPGRIAFVGHSAGAYLALTAGWMCHPRPAALVSFYGYADITRPRCSQPSPYYAQGAAVPRESAVAAVGRIPVSEVPPDSARSLFYVHCRQNGRWLSEVTGRDPQREPAWFDRFCPLRNIGHDYPPTLVLHGADDNDVPCEESAQLAEALTCETVPHEFLTIPGGGHLFDVLQREDPAVVAAMNRVSAFLETHLRLAREA